MIFPFKERGMFKFDPKILNGVRIPVLILDPVWLSHFKDTKDDKIQSLMKKVKDAMKENGRCNEQRESLSIRKKKCLDKIIELSSEAYDNYNPKAKEAMEKLYDEVQNINGELAEVEKKAASLPEKLDSANRSLLLTSVASYYQKMKDSQDRLTELNPLVNEAHEKLKQLMNEKLLREEEADKTYFLLHNMLGTHIIELLDDAYDNWERNGRR